nr:ribonuclease H-like domain-containing protein [Tanacetum cinerariifolium]
GPPSQVTIQSDFFFNKDLEYLRYGSKGGRPALSISEIKAAYYPNIGLEQMVPNQMWIEEECKYDIATIHTSEGDRRAARTHMRILSVVRIEVFSMYGDKYRVQMIMRFNEIHKFSDGTLHQIDEALDYRVKEFKERLKKEKSENKGRVPIEMELELEQTQQVSSYEASVAVCSNLRSLKPKRTIESRAKRSYKNLIRTLFHYAYFFIHCENIHNEDGNPARANIKQALGRISKRFARGKVWTLRNVFHMPKRIKCILSFGELGENNLATTMYMVDERCVLKNGDELVAKHTMKPVSKTVLICCQKVICLMVEHNDSLLHVEADDKAIHILLLGLLVDVCAAVDSCKNAHAMWLRVQRLQSVVRLLEAKLANEIRDTRLAKTHDPLALYSRTQDPFAFFANTLQKQQPYPSPVYTLEQPLPLNNIIVQQPLPNNNFVQQQPFMDNIIDVNNPMQSMQTNFALMSNAFKKHYFTQTNNQMISSNTRNKRIAQLAMNMNHDRQMKMVVVNAGNQGNRQM